MHKGIAVLMNLSGLTIKTFPAQRCDIIFHTKPDESLINQGMSAMNTWMRQVMQWRKHGSAKQKKRKKKKGAPHTSGGTSDSKKHSWKDRRWRERMKINELLTTSLISCKIRCMNTKKNTRKKGIVGKVICNHWFCYLQPLVLHTKLVRNVKQKLTKSRKMSLLPWRPGVCVTCPRMN